MDHYSNNSNNNHANAAIDSQARWVTCIAKADFWGDSRSTQLSFRKNARLEVDLRQYSQNGWRWGKIGNRVGWFPDWAAEPMVSQSKKLRTSSSHHRGLGRSRDRISPMLEKINNSQHNQTFYNQQDNDDDEDDQSGFGGQWMGGTAKAQPQPTESQSNSGSRRRPSSARMGRRNSTGMTPSGSMSWMEKWSALTTTKNQKQAEWDGSEVPQIVNGDGSITVLGADGASKSYKNEASYKSAEAVSRLAEITGIKIGSKNKSSRSHRSISTMSLSSNGSMGSMSNNTSGTTKNNNSTEKPKKNRFGGKFSKMTRRSSTTSISIAY